MEPWTDIIAGWCIECVILCSLLSSVVGVIASIEERDLLLVV